MIHFMEIQISLDGDQWCALLGEDLQEGVAGFGDTPLDALQALVTALASQPYTLPGGVQLG